IGLLLLAGLAVGTLLYVRWAFALPILLFENQCPRAALLASRERVRGVNLRVGFLLLSWPVCVLLLGAAVEAVFRLVAAATLGSAGERPIFLILVLLVAQGGLLATLSFVLVVGLGLVTRRLYLIRSQQLGLVRAESWRTAPDLDKPASPWNWRLAWLSLPLFLLAPLFLWADLST